MTPGVYCTSIHSIPMHVIISSPHIHHLYCGIPLIMHISEIINSQSRPSCLKNSLECYSERSVSPILLNNDSL